MFPSKKLVEIDSEHWEQADTRSQEICCRCGKKGGQYGSLAIR